MERLFSIKKIGKLRQDVNGYSCSTCDIACASGCATTCSGKCTGCTGCSGSCQLDCGGGISPLL